MNRSVATDADAENLCLKANQYGLAGVVVLPSALVRLEKYRDSTRIGAAIFPSNPFAISLVRSLLALSITTTSHRTGPASCRDNASKTPGSRRSAL